MTTFVDTSVVIYLLDENSAHHEWSLAAVNGAVPGLVGIGGGVISGLI